MSSSHQHYRENFNKEELDLAHKLNLQRTATNLSLNLCILPVVRRKRNWI